MSKINSDLLQDFAQKFSTHLFVNIIVVNAVTSFKCGVIFLYLFIIELRIRSWLAALLLEPCSPVRPLHLLPPQLICCLFEVGPLGAIRLFAEMN